MRLMRFIEPRNISRRRTVETSTNAWNRRNFLSALWERCAPYLSAHYQPERYYMRGPGPKSHKKG
jgi:hypothetical protein